jgi:EGF-like domain
MLSFAVCSQMPTPCVHGVCVATAFDTYNCSCEPGYTGQYCDQGMCEFFYSIVVNGVIIQVS